MGIGGISSSSFPTSSFTGRSTSAAGGNSELSEEDLRIVAELQKRDREVRAHEMAHVAAGGGLVQGGASYTWETGPDGRRYAVGGEVQIDVSPGRTPEETLSKAQQITAAALAPADPSTQDRQIAAQANAMALDAQREIAMQQQGEGSGTSGVSSASGASSTNGTSDTSGANTSGVSSTSGINSTSGAGDTSAAASANNQEGSAAESAATALHRLIGGMDPNRLGDRVNIFA